MFKNLNGFAVIYMFTSPSGKKYIGQSINFNQRYKKYLRNSPESIGKYFSAAILKYGGIKNFELTILSKFEIFENIEEVKRKINLEEIFFIEKYNSLKEGYNLTGGGSGSFKREISKETRLKLSVSNKGKNKVKLVQLICPICKVIFEKRPGQISQRLKQGVKPSCSRFCGIEQMKITARCNNTLFLLTLM
jgi:group I intron endonuclease